MDAALAPVLGLVVENFAFFIERGVLGAPEDGAGVGISRGEVGGDFTVFGEQGVAVVIPVDRHGCGVCDE